MTHSALFATTVLVLVWLVWSCSNRPAEINERIDSTRAALEKARLTGADRYAPDAMKLAERTYSRAMAEVETHKRQLFPFHSYDRAKEQLGKAKLAALGAVFEARAEREKTRQEAKRLIQEVGAILQSISLTSDDVSDVELEDLVHVLAAAKWAYQSGDYLNAHSKAAWIHAKVEDIE
jgi:hypothetical protein